MTITIDVPPEIASRISAEAAREGKEVPEVVQGLVQQHYKIERPPRRPIRPYDPAAALAALDAFQEGDEEEQKETLKILMEAIDRDRPGQRRIFGEGMNPMPPVDESA